MPFKKISKELKDQLYFVTFSVKNWYHIFDRHNRFKMLEEAFVYCQANKGLKIYAFVFMINHLHFVGQAPDLSAVIRDLKKYLSKEIQKNIIATEPSILNLFKEPGKNEYHLWQETNYPELIETDYFFEQKVNYIHYNPVAKEYVSYPEDWKWSSASKLSTRIQLSSF